MRISDWSSDVCSSDLARGPLRHRRGLRQEPANGLGLPQAPARESGPWEGVRCGPKVEQMMLGGQPWAGCPPARQRAWLIWPRARSEEHTSELQSLMRISYAVFCLKKKTT